MAVVAGRLWLGGRGAARLWRGGAASRALFAPITRWAQGVWLAFTRPVCATSDRGRFARPTSRPKCTHEEKRKRRGKKEEEKIKKIERKQKEKRKRRRKD